MSVDALSFYRLGRRLRRAGIPLLPKVLTKAVFYLHSSVLPLDAEIGQETVLGYGGLGVVIHREARIGRGCLISQHVTIGGRSGHPGAPVIGNFVRIGAGAQVLGKIVIGDHAQIGANAVVLRDVPAGAVVAGVPAREIHAAKATGGAEPVDDGLQALH